MAGVSDDFTENKTVGGVPCFTIRIQKWLPKNKKRRERLYQIQMVILTYFIYSLFNMARRPLGTVKSRLIDECGYNNNKVDNFGKEPHSPMRGDVFKHPKDWCNETFFGTTTDEFFGFLDSVYLVAYGLCLYSSGIISDCYNPRFYLSMGCLLSGFFCAVLSLADVWQIRDSKFFTMAITIFGACQSTGWPVVLSCVTHWYSGGKRGMFFGVWNTHNYMGSIVGIYLANLWEDYRWGFSFYIPGFILALTAILVYSCLVVDPQDLKELDKEPAEIEYNRRVNKEIPPWLRASRSIAFYDALMLPGVIEFSACMFFSRMVGYIFFFWLPTVVSKYTNLRDSTAAYYAVAYVIGGSLGGIVAGVLVDIFRRSALICAFFLLASIPVLSLSLIYVPAENVGMDIPIYVLIGLFVEAPYVVTSTSVSADLGTHKMIKRNHRALSTVGGIMEGTGAVGAALGTYMCGVILIRRDWSHSLYAMMGLQFIATLCLSRQAYKDFFKTQKRRTLTDYWRSPAL